MKPKAPVFPPIGPRDTPGRRIALAQDLLIKQLSSRVKVLREHLGVATQENRTLRHTQRRHAAALHCFQGSRAGLAMLLRRHNAEVRALQELLRDSTRRGHELSQKLWSSERELLHACDAVRRLRLLNQDGSLGATETLTRSLDVLSADLEKQSKRTRDLEGNLAMIRGSFQIKQFAEMRRTVEARQLSRRLEEEIRNLTHSIEETEKELKIRNIYSNRFQKRTVSVQRGASAGLGKYAPERFTAKPVPETKGHKSVQTDDGSSLPAKAPTVPPETEDLLERTGLEKNTRSSRETDTNQTAHASSAESEQTHREEPLCGPEPCPGLWEATPEPTTQGGEVTPSVSRPDPKEIKAQPESSGSAQTQTQASTEPGKNPVRIGRRYRFKETILNLHDGKPAYGTGPRFEPSFHLGPKAATKRMDLREELE